MLIIRKRKCAIPKPQIGYVHAVYSCTSMILFAPLYILISDIAKQSELK